LVGRVVDDLIAEPGSPVAAVWHPLGCVYVELARSATRSVRLHVWGLGAQHFRSSGLTLHAHDFDLSSAVLAGALDHFVYRECVGAPTHRVHEILYDGDVNLLQPTARCLRCVPEPPCRIGAGGQYTLDAGRFHHVQPVGSDLTATLVLATLRPDRQGLVLGPIEVGGGADAMSHIRTVRDRCRPDELRAILLRVRQHLDATPMRAS